MSEHEDAYLIPDGPLRMRLLTAIDASHRIAWTAAIEQAMESLAQYRQQPTPDLRGAAEMAAREWLKRGGAAGQTTPLGLATACALAAIHGADAWFHPQVTAAREAFKQAFVDEVTRLLASSGGE